MVKVDGWGAFVRVSRWRLVGDGGLEMVGWRAGRLLGGVALESGWGLAVGGSAGPWQLRLLMPEAAAPALRAPQPRLYTRRALPAGSTESTPLAVQCVNAV